MTLCVAQVLMGIPSDRRFLRAARRQLGHLFPYLPRQDALHKRRARLAEAIEWLVGVFAAQSPGASDDLLLLDSTPVECGRVGCGRVGIIDAFHGEGSRRHRPDR